MRPFFGQHCRKTFGSFGSTLLSALVRRSICVILPVIVLALALPSMAVDGRDFAGVFALSDISEQGDKVQGRLSVQVWNFSDSDLRHPVVALMSCGPTNAVPISSFPEIKELKLRSDVIVHQQFTVSKKEFEQWNMRGRGPCVVVLFRDSTGHAVQREIQMSRRPILPEAVNE